MNSKFFGTISLFLAAISWGLAFVFQHTGMESIGPFWFTAIRVGLGALVVGIIGIIVLKEKAFKWTKKMLFKGFMCGVFTTGCIVFQQIGIVNTTPGKAGFITALYIILVPIFASILLKRRYGIVVWIGVVVGLVGLYLLTVEDGLHLQLSDLTIMVCAVFFAAHVIYVERYASKIDSIKLNFMQLFTCSVICLILGILFEDISIGQIVAAKGSILYCGIASAGLGCTLQLVGQKYIEPATASLILSLEAVFGVIFEWLILHSIMSTREMLGCVIMFIAIVLIQLPSKKTEDKLNG